MARSGRMLPASRGARRFTSLASADVAWQRPEGANRWPADGRVAKNTVECAVAECEIEQVYFATRHYVRPGCTRGSESASKTAHSTVFLATSGFARRRTVGAGAQNGPGSAPGLLVLRVTMEREKPGGSMQGTEKVLGVAKIPGDDVPDWFVRAVSIWKHHSFVQNKPQPQRIDPNEAIGAGSRP